MKCNWMWVIVALVVGWFFGKQNIAQQSQIAQPGQGSDWGDKFGDAASSISGLVKSFKRK